VTCVVEREIKRRIDVVECLPNDQRSPAAAHGRIGRRLVQRVLLHIA